MKNLFTILAVLLASMSWSQSAIKLQKQQTKFYYGQLNLHGGFLNDINGDQWGFTSRSPKNQVVFQIFSKNQKNQQRGYTKSFAVASWKLRLGFEYDTFVNGDGIKTTKVNFKLYNTFVKFKTKWDRTSISIGNKSFPYGHNPKIDPVSSFMINPIKMDIGFAQDLGVFFKTPVSKNADLELSLTSGGILNKPYLVCNNLIVREESNIDLRPDFVFGEYSYQGTWLLTSRIGSPTYKSNEFGVDVVAGFIPSTSLGELTHINRIGGDWVYKWNERIKFVNQVFVGTTSTTNDDVYFTYNIQNNFDFYSGTHWMFSASHSINASESMGDLKNLFNHSINGSLTYVFSPHTRLRLNSFYTNVRDAQEKRYGVLIQFVTGIGKRP